MSYKTDLKSDWCDMEIARPGELETVIDFTVYTMSDMEIARFILWAIWRSLDLYYERYGDR